MTKLDLIRSSIKSIPDYPKAGIIFRDITSLLEVPEAFQATIDAIVAEFKDKGITKVVGTESRGFMQSANWLVTIPGLAILSLVLAFNLMGDGLRDALDPKLKQ